MAERLVCTYCGKDGHRASQCPTRPKGPLISGSYLRVNADTVNALKDRPGDLLGLASAHLIAALEECETQGFAIGELEIRVYIAAEEKPYA
jgi:hypothetical protein